MKSEPRLKIQPRPLSAKEEYRLLSKEEKKVVDELSSIIKKHQKSLGSLRTVECLRHALELM